VGIGKFVEKDILDRPISQHLQKSYIFKIDDGRPEIIDKDSDFPVKTLVASYHKIQRLTGTFVADGPTGLRLLSTNECKAIMGFPKSFKIPVSRTQMYRQMGNSVAVPVVKKVAEQMIETLREARVLKKEAKSA
jgi:DNA (cytosine-5)-methyltransferase 1